MAAAGVVAASVVSDIGPLDNGFRASIQASGWPLLKARSAKLKVY